MERSALILRRFDALGLSLRLFSCDDGTVGAEAPGVMIRAPHTVNSFHAYGETADEAVHALWQTVEDIDTGTDFIRVKQGSGLRYYRWNGAAWKEYAAPDIGLPATTEGAA